MKTMTKEQLAELLNGNEYRDEMTGTGCQAKQSAGAVRCIG